MNKALKVGAVVGGLVSVASFIGYYFSVEEAYFWGGSARAYALLWGVVFTAGGSVGILILTLPFWSKPWRALHATRGFCIGTLAGSVLTFSFIWLFLRPN